MINESQAKKYCRDDISKIENYAEAVADQTQMWVCHHRTAIWWNCTREDLIANECYYHRKACELIFLTPADHKSLHMSGENHPMYGKHHREEAKRKMSESHKGRPAHNKGKHHSEESKRKISESKKGRPAHNKGKPMSAEAKMKMSASRKGRTFSDEHRRNLSAAKKAYYAAKRKAAEAAEL